MASLSTNARFLDFFVDSVIAGKDINVTAPNQYASIMDVADAVAGIIAIESIEPNKRDCVYNLGPGVHYSILDYAESINRIGQLYGYKSISINVDDHGSDFAICMDCKRLLGQSDWKPKITKNMMLQNMFKLKNIK